MGLLSCTFPDRNQPLSLARDFQEKMAPTVIDIDETDVFASSIAKIESALGDGPQQEAFQPLRSMKRNAQSFGPQYRLTVRGNDIVIMTGAVNRRTLNLTWSDPIPDWLLRKVLNFSKGITGVEMDAEDNAGNPIDVDSAAHALV